MSFGEGFQFAALADVELPSFRDRLGHVVDLRWALISPGMGAVMAGFAQNVP